MSLILKLAVEESHREGEASFNDPKNKNQVTKSKEGYITGPGITNLIDPSEVSNISDQEIQKLVNIFQKRSDEITSRRLAPGVTQTRLIGR